MIYSNIEKIGSLAVKQIEKEIKNAKKQNEIIEPMEITLRGIYDDCNIIVTINLFYTQDERKIIKKNKIKNHALKNKY